jgi:hypothetical protein
MDLENKPSQRHLINLQIHADKIPPKVSVISTAPTEEKFTNLMRVLKDQTYQNFEFIKEVGNPVPDCWKRSIARSRGDILVFMDPEAAPVNERWLEELVAGVTDERTIVKGLEVTSSPLDPSSLAGRRQAFVENPFDEEFLWCEDSELFCRLNENGYRFVQIDKAPVVHLSKPESKTFIRRAFRYGLYNAQIKHRYPNSVALMNISMVIKVIIEASLNLIGMMVGSIIFFPQRHLRQPPVRS